MNANELADYLDKCVVGNDNDVYKQAVNMLRHQADYIKHLEEGLESSINLNKAQALRKAQEK
jgi:hypothetical protein